MLLTIKDFNHCFICHPAISFTSCVLKISGSKASSWLGLDSDSDELEGSDDDDENEQLVTVKPHFEGKAGEEVLHAIFGLIIVEPIAVPHFKQKAWFMRTMINAKDSVIFLFFCAF